MKHINHVSIPKPCSQNWSEMDVVAKGRFCKSCQKTVTDFTRLSNQQILASLSQSGNTCGRITATQLRTLNAIIAVEPPVSRFSWKRFSVAAAVISFLTLFRAEAKMFVPKASQYQSFAFKK